MVCFSIFIDLSKECILGLKASFEEKKKKSQFCAYWKAAPTSPRKVKKALDLERKEAVERLPTCKLHQAT